MSPTTLRLAIPLCLLAAAGCQAPAPETPSASPPPTAAASAASVDHACPGGASTPLPETAPGASDAPAAAAGPPAESSACESTWRDARELEELRVCHVVTYLGHPDVALRFMSLYEQSYRVRNRELWEALRVRVLFQLGRVEEAEAGAKLWAGTEVGRQIAEQIEHEKRWAGNSAGR